jgi:hypothetical protein
MAVFQYLEIEVPYGIQRHFGGLDIWLADVEMIYFYASLFGGLGIGHKFPDRRSRH